MLIEFSLPVLIVVDSIAWATIHMAVAWLGTQLPDHLFPPDTWWCRPRSWERGGRVYVRCFAVKQWKHLLPDAAAWFDNGFPKARLRSHDPAYLSRFARETCRGELVHWIVIFAAPCFLLWNPGWMGMAMLIYAVLANAPCIIVQRYNRCRLLRRE